MHWLLAFLAWLVSTTILGPVVMFSVLVLAGPHSSLLPSRTQPAVLLLGWLTFLVMPLWVARRVWLTRRARL
jgi:hypothetical protein